MRSRMTSITIARFSTVLLALVILLGAMSLDGLSGQTTTARIDANAAALQAYTFNGHVYRGQPYDTSTPVAGVTVGVWGDEDEWPEAGFARELLASTTTDASGAFSLSWTPGETFYAYLHIIEEDPPDTYSTGARADDQGAGYVKNFNVVSFLDLGDGTYTGIGFWDEVPASVTPTPTSTEEPSEHTPTPTTTSTEEPPEHTPTPTATQTVGPEEFPDLVVIGVRNEDDLICYEIENIGNAEAPGGHGTLLSVDGGYAAESWVAVALPPGEQWGECFDYQWECTPPDDNILVVTDFNDDVDEMDETNNQWEDNWDCEAVPTPTSTVTATQTPTATPTTPGGPTPTPTPTPTTTQTPTPTPTPTATSTPITDVYRRAFGGTVYHGEPGNRSEPLPDVRVELHGSDNPDEPGELVAFARTGRDGMFYLANWASEGRHYPYYHLLLTHPGAEVIGVEPGEGAEFKDLGWLMFPPPMPEPPESAEDSVDTEWYLGNRPERAPWEDLEPVPSKAEDLAAWDEAEPKQPIDFKLDGIELTQAIQCFDVTQGDSSCPDNSLPLVAQKLTAARVYISRVGTPSSDPQYPNVRVDLSISYAWQPGPGQAAAVAGITSKRFTVPLKWDRNNVLTTADFLIPSPQGGIGTGQLTACAVVNADEGWLDPDPTNNSTCSPSAQVVNTRPVTVKWLRMNYKPTKSTKYPQHPFTGPSLTSLSWLKGEPLAVMKWLFPTAKLNYSPYGTGTADYYFELAVNEGGKAVLKKYTPDIRDDFVVAAYSNPAMDVFQKTRLIGIAGSSPSYDTLFAWFPLGATRKHPIDGMAEGAPPVDKYGKGRVALSSAVRASRMLSHEVGHNFGLGHFPCSLNPAQQHNWPAPYNSCSPVEVSFKPYKMAVEPTYTFMTYGGKSISPPEWKYLVDKLKVTSSASGASTAAAQDGPYLIVSGWLNSEAQGELAPIYMLDGSYQSPEPADDPTAEILLLDGAGHPLESHAFAPQFQAVDSESADFAGFLFQLPAPGGLERVELHYDGSLVAERQPSDHAPEVYFLSPTPGIELGGIVPVTWEAFDLDDDDLSYALLYTHDDGATWLPLTTNLTEPTYELDVEQLPGGDACFLRVLVSDGWHTGEAMSGPFVVRRKSPDAAIVTPVDVAGLGEVEALVLSSSVYDPEDGLLADAALSWWSDRDGLLGRGATLIVPPLTLSPGWQTITLRAADSDSQIGSASVDLFVGHRVYLPVILKNYS